MLAILGIGIGVTVSVFSMVDGVVLRPLPYRDPGRLVAIERVAVAPPFESNGSFSYTDFEQLQARATSFSDMAVTYRSGWSQIQLGEPFERLRGAFVSPNFFAMFGRAPIVGRAFTAQENGANVILVSEPLATRRFGSAELALGRDLQFSGARWRIVGIMPADFRVPFLDSQFWAPVMSHPEWIDKQEVNANQFSSRWDLMGRLPPGVPLATAQAELDSLYKPVDGARKERLDRAMVVPLREHFTGEARRPFVILGASVGLLLLIACANVANLLLARAASRRREFAIRAALGAGVARLLRQALAEATTICVLAGALGVGVSVWLVGALKAFAPEGTPRVDQVAIDGRVLVFAIALSVAMGLFLGVASVWGTMRRQAAEPLNSATRSSTISREGNRQKNVLVAAEFAIAMVLLTGSALLIRSFVRVARIDPGFRPEHILTVRIELPPGINEAQVSQFYRDATDRIRNTPGVEAVGTARSVFQLDVTRTHSLRIVEGQPPEPVDKWQTLEWAQVGEDYFQTLGIPLLDGRFFDERDGPMAPPVAIVNETLARRYWPGENPVGKRLKGQDPRGPNHGKNDDWVTVVGVVKDMRAAGRERKPFGQIYEAQAQAGIENNYTFVIRWAGDPAREASAMRAAIHDANRNVTVTAMNTMEQELAEQETQRRFETWLIGLFSAMALGLAALGVFAVMHFAVSAKTREIGIRMAVGARASDILHSVIAGGTRLALAGIAVGAFVSVWITQLLASMLFQLEPTDPISFAAAAAILTMVAIAASLLPAVRAARLDP
ncbi:MAG TPA: ABC transporter permease, partial [Bryobacteraceae bacterium]|nr:ABC transporter permease [Bryobacteraceae bacterium]